LVSKEAEIFEVVFLSSVIAGSLGAFLLALSVKSSVSANGAIS
jgi:hypothetical protein